MFQDLFNTAISLIFKPSDAWEVLRKKRTDDHESFLSGFVYPCIGLTTLAAFLGVFITQKGFDIQLALKETIVAAVSMFGGFFLASVLINEILRMAFRREPNMKLCQQFVGYSSSLLYGLNIVLSLMPGEFFFLRILLLYTIYIVWEGAIPYMEVTESEQLKFVSIATTIIILTPLAIAFFTGLLMPGLQQ